MNADSLSNRLLFRLPPKTAPAIGARVALHAGAKSVVLRRGHVMTIADTSAARRIQVTQGAVWLTGTPAENDIVLQANESLGLTNHYPFVVEALTDAEITLVR